ncbi:MAG: xanthine dehydrogenase family protein molybdopterin-binding subunit [Alphaproteobacteria bacterium]|jgi:carbon-monoxide dehydrogenase large subunit|nr:xanthine dehydrogenase family protein molybdopterin-binding subunit [Alphaproteobacteria bacterium]
MKAGIGASHPRKEDARHLTGRGRFVADLQPAGCREVAFVRSPLAHARVRGIERPEGSEGSVFTATDMTGAAPIRGDSSTPGYKAADYPALATDKVRFVGQAVAMCLADNRAEAEDLAQEVFVDLEELPPVPDMVRAAAPDSPRLHEGWGDNLMIETRLGGDLAGVADAAAITITREIDLNRQCMAPMEGKAVLAEWDRGRQRLTVYTSTQIPHVIRRGLSICLHLAERQIRVITPDVGGGFGFKAVLHPEEVAIAWLAMQVEHPVRWSEDRREHLTAAANCREHHYLVTAHAAGDGRLLGIDVEIEIDAGAYSIWPFHGGFEAAQAGASFPGPYVLPAYRCVTRTFATSKPPLQPYRGVSRTGICFALELVIDAIAREVGREPHEVRALNLPEPEAMPYTNVMGKLIDSGDYPESVRRAVAAIDVDAVRRRQAEGESDGRQIGLGFATYTEQTAHGTKVFAGAGMEIVPGHEQARLRLAPDGALEIEIGVQSHGQGMETTMAQVASEVLGIDIDLVSVVHGDTGETPFSTGTYASRSMVMAGGAVGRGCRILAERIAEAGAALLQCEPSEVTVADGMAKSPGGETSFAEIANAVYARPDQLPEEVVAKGLEALGTFKPTYDHGAFAYATHAVVVAVDPELGEVELLDYVIAEDCGTKVNPLIVDGQTIGGAAQGIGNALYEEVPFDDQAQPLASTLADYLMPGATEVPAIRIEHMETPSPFTEFGIKGVGEGGAIAPPAAIANAINDALRADGVEILEAPMTPRRVFDAIQKAQETGK